MATDRFFRVQDEYHTKKREMYESRPRLVAYELGKTPARQKAHGGERMQRMKFA